MPVVDYHTALTLRDAGLGWNPKPGDSYYLPNDSNRYVLQGDKQLLTSHAIYAPGVDDMQQEIMVRGYGHQIYSQGNAGWVVEVFDLYSVNTGVIKHGFFATTPEKALAEVLVWLLTNINNN